MDFKINNSRVQRKIELMKERADKFETKLTSVYEAGLISDLRELSSELLSFVKENSILKEQIFNIEQSCSEENKWENILAAKMQRAFSLNNSEKDFFEITNSINNDIFVITIQKKFGKTPYQLLKEAEIHKSKALSKVSNLNTEISFLYKKNLEKDQLIRLLNNYKNKTLEDLELYQNELGDVIDWVNRLISSNNSIVYRNAIKKMHVSFSEVVSEAWEKYLASHDEVLKLKKKLSQLETISKKKLSRLRRH